MSKRLTGLSLDGLQWEYVPGNKDLARRVFVFLEDRRVLSQSPDREDYESCRRSADQIRHQLTAEIMNVKAGGPLERSLKKIRAACKAFIDSAGQDAKNFQADHRAFVFALTALRETVGREVGIMSATFGVQLDPALEAIVPEDEDLSWIPGMGQ